MFGGVDFPSTANVNCFPYFWENREIPPLLFHSARSTHLVSKQLKGTPAFLPPHLSEFA